MRDWSDGPRVTFSFFLYFFFFFLCRDGERGRAGGLAGGVERPAGVAASVLTEGVHNDKRGCVGHLVKVEDHVPAGPHGLPLVEPADLWPRCAGHAGVKAHHLAMPHRAAGDWLDEGRFLVAAGGDVPLRLRPGLHRPLLF